MAKKTISGFSGSITLGTGIVVGVDVTGFSCEIDIEEDKIPPAFGSKWNTSAPGAGSVKGTLRGNLAYDAAGTKPFDPSGSDWTAFIGVVTLTSTTGCTITGTMMFNNVKLDRENGKHGTMEASFVNNLDDVAVTWDVS